MSGDSKPIRGRYLWLKATLREEVDIRVVDDIPDGPNFFGTVIDLSTGLFMKSKCDGTFSEWKPLP